MTAVCVNATLDHLAIHINLTECVLLFMFIARFRPLQIIFSASCCFFFSLHCIFVCYWCCLFTLISLLSRLILLLLLFVDWIHLFFFGAKEENEKFSSRRLSNTKQTANSTPESDSISTAKMQEEECQAANRTMPKTSLIRKTPDRIRRRKGNEQPK